MSDHFTQLVCGISVTTDIYYRVEAGQNHMVLPFTSADNGTIPANGVITAFQLYISKCSRGGAPGAYLDLSSIGDTDALSSASEQALLVPNFNASGIRSFVNSTDHKIDVYGRSTSSNPNMGDMAKVIALIKGCNLIATVYYSIAGPSTGSLSATQVAQNSNIKLTINAGDSAFTHVVTWKSSSGQTVTQNINAGVSETTLTVPAEWTTGTASVTLATYSGGTLKGSYTYNFTVTLDTSTVIPTTGDLLAGLVHTQYVPTGWDVAVQGYTQALLMMPNANAGGSGAAFARFDYACGSSSYSVESSTLESWTTEILKQTGQLTCKGSITNSYGNTAAAEDQTIIVRPYSDPSVTSLSAYRCLGDSSHTPNDLGPYIRVNVAVSFSNVRNAAGDADLNSLLTLQAQYKKKADSAWSAGVTITNNTVCYIGGDLDTADDTYELRIVVVDEIQNLRGTSTTLTQDISTADVILHFADGGRNMSVGFAGTLENAFQLASNFGMYHGTKQIPIDDLPGLADKVSDLETETIPIKRGGTGSITAEDALKALGAAAASHTHTASDISGAISDKQLPFKMAAGTCIVTNQLALVAFASASYKVNLDNGAFTYEPIVILTPKSPTISGAQVVWPYAMPFVYQVSTSGFNTIVSNADTGSYTCYWIAIGL